MGDTEPALQPLDRSARRLELWPATALYGRGRELDRLAGSIERAREGQREFVLVLGEAGVGKTALLEALRARAKGRARVVSGRYEPRGCVPYAGLIKAVSTWLKQLDADTLEAKALWRRRIAEALGGNAAVLREVLPGLGSLIGPQPEVVSAGLVEDENRFALTFTALVRALSSPDAPLVLVLDDLHWADSASLRVLCAIATDPGAGHLAIIGAARTEALTPGNALHGALDALRVLGAGPTELALAPLSVHAIAELCRDVLRAKLDDVSSLAALVLRHSAGLPLYVHRFLRLLHERGLLVFDEALGGFVWDEVQIANLPVPERAVDLFVAVLRSLPPAALEIAGAAACAGRRFELGLIAEALGHPRDETARQLSSLARDGLIVELDTTAAGLAGRRYRFAHDRVQQAAYDMFPAPKRSAVHLRIGRLWLERLSPDEIDERIFRIVDQFERGAALVTDPADHRLLSELEQRAGRLARRAAAYGPALSHFRRGIHHLPANAFEAHHEFAVGLYLAAAESALVTRDRRLLEQLADTAEERGISLLERAEFDALRLVACVREGAFDEGIRVGRAGLARLGLEAPDTITEEQLAKEIRDVGEAVGAEPRQRLLHMPRMADPVLRARCTLLASLATATWFRDPQLSAFLDAQVLRMFVAHGHVPQVASACLAVARELRYAESGLELALTVGELGMELARRLHDAVRVCESMTIFALFVDHWRAPMRSALALLERACEVGFSAGELTFSGYARSGISLLRFAMGETLGAVERDAGAAIRFARRIDNGLAYATAVATRQAVRCLAGRTRSVASFEDEDFDEAAFLARIDPDPVAKCIYYGLRLQVSLTLGDLKGARRSAAATEQYMRFARGVVFEHQYSFHRALLDLAELESEPDAVRERRRASPPESLSRAVSDFEVWARHCPENFRHKQLLLAAELARVEGRRAEASDLYALAIEAACERGFVQDEALAHELAVRNHREQGRTHMGSVHAIAALRAYERWGATAKVEALTAELREQGVVSEPAGAARSTERSIAGAVEFGKLRRAVEEIAGVLPWHQLVERSLRASLKLTDSTRAALVLEEQGRLSVLAELPALEASASFLHTPLDRTELVPRSLVQRVWRSGEPLSMAELRASDPELSEYLFGRPVLSMLALPIARQGLRAGVLYLESDAVANAYGRAQVASMELLSAQLAVALENSVLFEQLRVEIDERRRAEDAVRFLANAGVALAESLDSEATLARTARLSVQFIADFALVHVVLPDDAVRRAAAAHDDGWDHRLIDAAEACFAPGPGRAPQPAARVIHSGRPLLLPDLNAIDLHAYTTDPCQADALQRKGLRSLLSVPMLGRGRVIGALTLGSLRRSYGPPDLELAEELARRAALAVDNAQLYEQAQEAVRLRDEFLSIASHELRGPLSGLQLGIQSLAKEIESTQSAALARTLAITQRQVKRLSRLVDELLDVARLHSGRLHLAMEQVDFADVVVEVIERLRDELEHAGCATTLDVPGSLVGRWDRMRLEQIVHNLITNAIKFGPGAPIDVRLEPAFGEARLRVRDHGIGIAPDRLPRIFERFERAVTTQRYGGLGLGLYIVREIVAALGGSVEVESELGKGSTFTVRLPVSAPQANARTALQDETRG